MRFVAELGGETIRIEVTGVEGRFKVKIGEEIWEVHARRLARGGWSILIGSASHLADVTEKDGGFLVDVNGETFRIRVEEETRHVIRTRGGVQSQAAGQVLVAPLPGKVVHVAVSEGQTVKAGDGLIVIEAMKMENEFKATAAGAVKEVRVEVGQSVNAGDLLLVIG